MDLTYANMTYISRRNACDFGISMDFLPENHETLHDTQWNSAGKQDGPNPQKEGSSPKHHFSGACSVSFNERNTWNTTIVRNLCALIIFYLTKIREPQNMFLSP